MNTAFKKQLGAQDQFGVAATHGLDWANQNRRKLYTYVGVALGVLALILIAFAIFQRRTASASAAFGAAMQTYQTPVATAGQPAAPGTKTFPSVADRANAANAQFLAVAQQYGSTEPGKLARYFTGLTYLEAGKNGPAEDSLKQVADSWNGDVAALAKLSLAQMYQQTGRNAEAASLYEQLSKGHASTVPPGMAQIELAELYQSEGKDDQARKIYAQLKDKDKDAKGTPGPIGSLAAAKLNPTAEPQQ